MAQNTVNKPLSLLCVRSSTIHISTSWDWWPVPSAIPVTSRTNLAASAPLVLAGNNTVGQGQSRWWYRYGNYRSIAKRRSQTFAANSGDCTVRAPWSTVCTVWDKSSHGSLPFRVPAYMFSLFPLPAHCSLSRRRFWFHRLPSRSLT